MPVVEYVPQLNLKGMPLDVVDWIRREAERRRVPQNEVWADAARRLRGDPVGLAPVPTLFDVQMRPRVTAPRYRFRFVDLFAGIGGFRIALDNLGGECVFTSEWDKNSQRTYGTWFGELPQGDINEIDPASIPDHDVLAAGFPCQPFSIAGVSKKRSLGQPDGFNCERQGNLFFRICDVVQVKRPPILILENVKNLRSHDAGRTWTVIRSTLENELNYQVHHRVIDAASYVPQHRERVFIVCLDREVFGRGEQDFEFPEAPIQARASFGELLEPRPDPRYTLTDHLWAYLQKYAEKHRAKGNGFGFGLVDPLANPDLVTRTLSARYYKDGSEILIYQGARQNPRRLTPLECARLMGFDSKVRSAADIVVSDTQAYRQFGNAVVPHVVEAVARQALLVLDDIRCKNNGGCALKGLLRPKRKRMISA
ncbi:MAG: DNA (cytosine-5-)-methyltransferase [Phycisphaerae bacterium]|nr:DNA (cytosine-5-)-methyltransferase [Phycisphaerae bacterium]